MSMTFSDGVVAVSAYWKSVGKYDSSHRVAVNGLQNYLTANGIPYSPNAINQWLEANRSRWKKSTYIHYRRALKELELIINEEPIVKKFDYRENPLDYLPMAWQLIIKSYRISLENDLTREPINVRVKNCVEFAEFACSKGLSHPNEIPAEIIANYCLYLSPEGTKCIKNQTLQYFLQYLSTKGMLPFHRTLLITSPLQGKAYIYVSNLAKTRRWDMALQGIKPIDFWNDAVCFAKYLILEHGYNHEGIKHNYLDYLQMYYIFCAENNLTVSVESQKAWLSVMSSFWDNFRRTSHATRALTLYNKYRQGHSLSREELCRQQHGDKSKAKQLNKYYKGLLDDYLASRQKDYIKESTIITNRTAVISFLSYLQDIGFSDVCDLKAIDVKNYFHYLSKGIPVKGRWQVYCIKSLLKLWQDDGLTDFDLSRAVPLGIAPTRRIVEILSDEEIARIYEYRNNAQTAIQYRDIAVLFLGLLMGLRKVDIVNLRFSDIDWKQCTISITQQKTYRPLVLPMPTAVGNSIYNYMKNGRPDLKTNYIFLSAVAPYRKANVAICDSAIRKVLPEHNVSFHILRRTFASTLLKSGSSVDMIKETLGHSSLESINRYLSVDNEALKSCCLSLERTVI